MHVAVYEDSASSLNTNTCNVHWRRANVVFTRMFEYKVALCMFSGEVTLPVFTEEDKRIGQSDIVPNQPPVSVAKHAEHAG